MSIKYPSQLLKFEQELHVVTKQSLLTITKQAKQQKKTKTQSKSDNQQLETA